MICSKNKLTKKPLSSTQHKGLGVLPVSAVPTFPSNTAVARRRIVQGKAYCSWSGLILIARITEGKAFPAKGSVYVRKLQIQTQELRQMFYLVDIY